MISYDEALARLIGAVQSLPGETIGLDAAGGRTLAKRVVAAIDAPRADVSAIQSAPAESKMAQVCIAFIYAYTAGNSDNGWTVREAGLLPVVAYHHLRGREKKTRESKEALVSLGAAVDDDEESQDLVSSLFGETVLRECPAT